MTEQQQVIDIHVMTRLKSRKQSIWNGLMRLDTFLNSIDERANINVRELRLRRDKTVSLLDDFDKVQFEIELIENTTDDVILADRNAFEQLYYRVLARMDTIISNHGPANNTLVAGDIAENDNTIATPHTTVQVRLPQIELPRFSGDYKNWMSFHDTFSSLIHNNTDLSIIQKFQYLKAALIGDAAHVVDAIDITVDNYMVAWRLLNDRYHNIRLIVRNHTRDLFELAPMQFGSPNALRHILDETQRHLRCLKALDQPTEHWDTLLIHMLISKLDNKTISDWETHCTTNVANDLPSFDELTAFLNKRCQATECLNSQAGSSTVCSTVGNQTGRNHNFHSNQNEKRNIIRTTLSELCPMCNKNHGLYKCVQFRALSMQQRLAFVTSHKLCGQCMYSHPNMQCKFHKCYICKSSHHHLLHPSSAHDGQRGTTVSITNIPQREQFPVFTGATGGSQIILATVQIFVTDAMGDKIKCRALLDSGSQSNLITSSFFKKLALSFNNVSIPVSGIGNARIDIKKSSDLMIESLDGSYRSTAGFLVLNNIVDNLPTFSMERTVLKIPPDLHMADASFYTSGPIDVLLGAEIFYNTLMNGQVQLGKNLPSVRETRFGWIVSCAMTPEQPLHHKLFTGVIRNSPRHNALRHLDKTLTKFWALEQLSRPSTFSPTERYCEELFISSTQRDPDGRFIVHLPLRDNVSSLGTSGPMAERRFRSLEKRLNGNPALRCEYNKFMSEYISLGHMSLFTYGQGDSCANIVNYLPHHPVMKESSTTTKMRVVFDGSAKTTSGLSLNDILHTGPNIQRDIFEVLLRFRRHYIAMVADIEKMYRQIYVHPQFRHLQCIMWRDNSADDIHTFALNTITYGTTPSAYLAIRCLKQVAIDGATQFPTASTVALNDFYVDDLLTGADTMEKALDLYNEINKMMQSACFNLRKWGTNDAALASRLLKNGGVNDIMLIDGHNSTKTLGLVWNTCDDSFRFHVPALTMGSTITKRGILSNVARLYDPLGLLGPVIFKFKLIIQQLWTSKVGWDEAVPNPIQENWKALFNSLESLPGLRIPRNINPYRSTRMQLHGFSDASNAGYGACLYLRTMCLDTNGCTVALLGSKSRVAPLDKISIPRLELCAALLLAGLFEKVANSIEFAIESCYLWTDSTIVLGWINCSSHLFNVFVANRVCEIQRLTNVADWRHIASQDNPADSLSRGLTADQITTHRLWWYGPPILSESAWSLDKSMPAGIPSSILPELRPSVMLAVIKLEADILERYSSFYKLTRVVACLFRFVHNSRVPRETRNIGSIALWELTDAKICIIKLLQRTEFSMEYNMLAAGKALTNSSRLLCLGPFLDGHGLIRVGGRLQNSTLAFESKHPILLPSAHHITRCIMTAIHMEGLHAGPQLLLALTRKDYWPLYGKNMARSICRKCITCFRARPIIQNEIMGNLPADRVVGSRPFDITGVDYCGPFSLKPIVRSKCTLKGYIAVFVCFTTKSVHLELVTDLTTERFLAAFTRFIARRGAPRKVYSDNAKNFVGADNKLKQFLQDKLNDYMFNTMSRRNIEWKFIPPRAPHMGGLWEAAVKSVKYHLCRTIKGTYLTYDAFITLISEIEMVLNSRPLYPLSTDPNDPDFLTPNHFLLGSNASLREMPINNIQRYHHIQTIRAHFWQRWSREYLNTMQQRNKWRVAGGNNIKLGDMVIIVDDERPTNEWLVGRIEQLHNGQDNKTRVVTIRTPSGVYKRPIGKICLMPINEDNKN